MDKLKALLHGQDMIPFVLAAGSHINISVARIAEALIIALITGGVAVYGTTQVMEAKMEVFMKTYERDYQTTLIWRGYVQEEINKNQDRISELKK